MTSLRPLDFSPDDRRSLKRRLSRALIGRPLRWFDQVGSTNDLAWDWVARGAPEGAVVVARGQDAGRGRDGRGWVSPAGAGLWLSIVLRPGLSHPAAGMLPLSLGFGLAVALRRLGLNASVKWPNDILLNGRKVAGVLVEAQVGGRSGSVDVAVAGIGLNWLRPPGTELAHAAGGLAEAWARASVPPPSQVDLFSEVLGGMERSYLLLRARGAEPFVRAWPRVSAHYARVVEVRRDGDPGAKAIRGLAGELRPDGGLEVWSTGCGGQVVHAGEVRLIIGDQPVPNSPQPPTASTFMETNHE